MANKNDKNENDPNLQNSNGLSRRDFVKKGAVAGLGTAAMLEPGSAQSQATATAAEGIVWDYEVDVVIVGAGCAGLTAAIRAKDLGASVLVVDQNFDLATRSFVAMKSRMDDTCVIEDQ